MDQFSQKSLQRMWLEKMEGIDGRKMNNMDEKKHGAAQNEWKAREQ